MKVLFVEDHEALFAVFEHTYPRLQVTWADTLEKARKSLETDTFDVILLDLTLSDSKGMDTVKAMVNRGIPVVVMTAHPSKEFVAKALELGAADYIHKRSFLDIDVEERIRLAVEKHRQTKRKYSSFSFGDIEQMKRFISCPPFETCGSRGARREAVMA